MASRLQCSDKNRLFPLLYVCERSLLRDRYIVMIDQFANPVILLQLGPYEHKSRRYQGIHEDTCRSETLVI